jgi:hypothetical protein
MSANFLDYTVALTRDGLSRIFPESGLFTFPVTITQDGLNSIFDLGTDPIEGIDNAGHVLILTGASRTQNIPYENTTGDHYWLGLVYTEIPDGIYTNPRTGVPEYDKWKEEVGMKDKPTSVVDDGDGTLTINVNSLFLDGGDHTGRTVKVWLVNPMSVDDTVAIEDLVVYYSGGNNLVASNGDFGQSTISTNTADYLVVCLGITTFNAGVAPAANPFASNYIIIGNITGGNPGSNDNGAQRDLSGGGGHTLQKAYDGLSGTGSGRNITISAGGESVEIRKTSTGVRSHDIYDMSLRLRTDIPTGLPAVGYASDSAIDVTSRFLSGPAFVNRTGYADFTGGDKLRIAETVSVSAATVTFTRGGSLDLTLTGNVGQIREQSDLVEISGSSLGNNGVYVAYAVASSSTLTVRNPDGTTPTFVVEAGLTARMYRRRISIGDGPSPNLLVIGMNDFFEDNYGFPAGTNGIAISIRVPETTDDNDVIFRQYRDVTSDIRFFANGDAIFSGSVDITGSLVVTGNIQATDITATDDIVATGDLSVTNGHLTVTTGNITATNGHIYSNNGDIKSLTGIVSAGDSFTYYTPKTLVKNIGAALFNPAISGDYAYLDYSNGYWELSADTTVSLLASINLPDGCTITGVDVKFYNVNYPTNRCQFDLERVDINFGTPTGAPSVSSMATGLASADAWVVETDSSITNPTINNDSYAYQMVITMDKTGARFAGIQITYTIQTIKMN